MCDFWYTQRDVHVYNPRAAGRGAMGAHIRQTICACVTTVYLYIIIYVYNNFADSLVEDPPDTNDSLVNHNDGPVKRI